MSTTKPRVNVAFDDDVVKVIKQLAKQNHVSVSKFTSSLVLEALEMREDLLLSRLSDSRLTPNPKVIGHKDAWQ